MLHTVFDFLKSLTNPDGLMQLLSLMFSGWQGYALLFGIVFAETGLLAGFFLPGDSLLFTVGVVAGAGGLNIWAIIGVLIVAAVVGDGVGYLLGRKAGVSVYNRPDSRFFKREHLVRTQAFYEKHGGKTIIYARFVPIVRTFAPFIAGVAQMDYPRFLSFNIFGGIGWVISMTMAGYFLGEVELVRRHFEKVIVGIVFVSVLPIVLEYFRGRGRSES
ncbi:MAG: VTT domain-containing protein [Acidobacteriota bacterium]|jgi:membrane-associated protein|nr:VTT domain-containing protein [Bryobacteraceae bacterium CoA2 C42]MCA2964131.1 VTT domain-containing protein [Acidobacteriaceae bacterium]